MSPYNDFLSFPKEEDQNTHREEVNESAFRQALERLGKGKPAPRSAGGVKTPAAKARPARQADPTQRRRKFVQDGDVRVEHHSLATGRATPRAIHAQQEDRGEIEHLRHKVQFEQKLREQAELRLSEAQAQIRSLTTRIGHADVIAAEHKDRLAARDAELLAARADLFNAREENSQLREEVTRLKSRQRTVETRPTPAQATTPQDETPADEPEPVKWWLR
ncbi:hypothetical protein [Komagataeibacter swingsii]|uniref:Uncharacterized protein n=1 Tax=Komagataeibacter swingsii TaxID=215220 RepID=A0A850NY57_9PROT|nr:hypothetical protein [Komagataeibacter swingsii]AHI26047.1 hypothetical protein H845_2117 [Komagataeibacter xylinus E25]NVN35883.1 hypothetical protein [Komagataeibacter swingsii]RFP02506.1 hypothetical protein BGC31_09300 [Komagataeibacter xylinus]RFP06277.1 hypothetical protein BFX83_01950 [Komagataeibacter xylinus]